MPAVHNINVVSGIPKGLDPGKGHGISNPQGQFFNQRPALGSSTETGIYNPVGDLDDIPKKRHKEHETLKKRRKKKRRKKKIRFDLDVYLDQKSASAMNRKIGQSGHVASPDSLGYNKRDKFSATPDATGPGHTALVANNNIEGSLIFEEFLKEYIFEVLNENGGSSMSVNYHLNKAGHSGKLHPKGSVGPPLSPVGGRSFNAGRITQKPSRTASGVIPAKSYHKPNDRVTDEQEFEDVEGSSTFYASKIFFDSEGKVYEDELNASEYNPYVKV